MPRRPPGRSEHCGLGCRGLSDADAGAAGTHDAQVRVPLMYAMTSDVAYLCRSRLLPRRRRVRVAAADGGEERVPAQRQQRRRELVAGCGSVWGSIKDV